MMKPPFMRRTLLCGQCIEPTDRTPVQYHSLPPEIAEYLCAKGVAKVQRPPRGSLFEVTSSIAQGASVVVGLLQAPMLYRYYAEALRSTLKGAEDRVQFRMRGPNGSIEILDVTDRSDVGKLAEELRQILG